MDYYLKAPDAETMSTVLVEAGVAQLIEGGLIPAAGTAIDIIGVWYERTGGTDDAPVFAAVPGYHCNVRAMATVEWPATVELMEPTTPWRLWG